MSEEGVWEGMIVINVPWSTRFPPASSVGLTSFQKTIRNCPSFCVRVTNTSPSFSSSSIAAGASFHDSLSTRTDSPLPFFVDRWISVNSAALFLNVKSCWVIVKWSLRREGKGTHLVGEEVRLWVELDLVVHFELFAEDGVRVDWRLCHEGDIFYSHRALLALFTH
jgi:hypothetical protein